MILSLSGSLTVSGSTGNTGLKISSGSVLENVNPQRYLAYNTSSGDIYMTTGSVGFSIVHLNDVGRKWSTTRRSIRRSTSCNSISFSLL
jgi:hypothetical protein